MGLTIHYKRPFLYEKQAFAFLGLERIAAIRGSTKSGKTHAAIVFITEEALLNGKKGYHYWWVSPSVNQSKIAFDRLKLAIPANCFTANETNRTITLINGAILEFKTGEDSDKLYGQDVYACVIDEASRVREASFHAIRSTLTATQGKLRMVGNVITRRDWFFQLAERIKAGGIPGATFHNLTSADAVGAGIMPQEEIDQARALLPERIFNCLYLNIPDEDGLNPFGFEHIQRCKRPLSQEKPIVFGVDLGKHQDWSVIIGLDQFGQVCFFDRWQGLDWGVSIDRIKAVVRDTQCLMDSTGLGDPIFDIVSKHSPNFNDFVYTSKSKQQLIEGLAIGIQSGQIRYPEGLISEELESFEYHYGKSGVKYSAPDGYFDDCVNSLALAWKQYLDKPKEYLTFILD